MDGVLREMGGGAGGLREEPRSREQAGRPRDQNSQNGGVSEELGGGAQSSPWAGEFRVRGGIC